MSNQYYFFGTRTTFILAAPKIFCRVNGDHSLGDRYHRLNFHKFHYAMTLTAPLKGLIKDHK